MRIHLSVNLVVIPALPDIQIDPKSNSAITGEPVWCDQEAIFGRGPAPVWVYLMLRTSLSSDRNQMELHDEVISQFHEYWIIESRANLDSKLLDL
jgi:hypothetical protein